MNPILENDFQYAFITPSNATGDPGIEPFDIWMCTCNSEQFLPMTLKRISEVIPSEVVNRKFIVDDFSSDCSKEVVRRFGWEVFENRTKGLHNALEYSAGTEAGETSCYSIHTARAKQPVYRAYLNIYLLHLFKVNKPCVQPNGSSLRDNTLVSNHVLSISVPQKLK